MLARATKCVAVALLLAATANAQSRNVAPGTGRGQVTLQVQVLTDNQATLDQQALIRVRNVQEGDERWETTHLGSQTSISGLTRGPYSVEVSAVGFQAATVDVDLRAPVQSVQVTLQTEKKKTAYDPPDLSGLSHKAREQCAKGIAALQKGKLQEAEKQFRKAVKSAPTNGHVHYLLAVALLQKKDVDQAIQMLEKATSLDPVHIQALTALGALRLSREDYAGAGRVLEHAIAVNDRPWRPHWLLANVYLEQQEYEKARAQAELAFALSNRSAAYAELALGEALSGLGRYREAVSALEGFLQQASTGPDAAQVRNMIEELNGRPDEVDAKQPAIVLAASSFPLQPSPMLSNVAPAWAPADVDSVSPPVVRGAECPAARVFAGVTQSVSDLVEGLDRFTAVRTQVHEQLDEVGDPIYRQTRKTRYLATITQRTPGDLELNEYGQDLSGLGAFTDGIHTRGMLGLALIFHPALKDDYQLDCEGLGSWKGEPAWLVHFRQKPGRMPQLQIFHIAGQNVSIALKGRAWIAASRFRIVHIEADLQAPLTDIELRSEHQVADYGPVEAKKSHMELWLPKDTRTYLDLAGHHYLFTDHFDDFVLFSVDAGHSPSQSRDPN